MFTCIQISVNNIHTFISFLAIFLHLFHVMGTMLYSKPTVVFVIPVTMIIILTTTILTLSYVGKKLKRSM